MAVNLMIIVSDKDGMYREVEATYEQIADASMIIWQGKYYYFHKMDTSTSRILGIPIFKEGIPPVNLTPYYLPG